MSQPWMVIGNSQVGEGLDKCIINRRYFEEILRPCGGGYVYVLVPPDQFEWKLPWAG